MLQQLHGLRRLLLLAAQSAPLRKIVVDDLIVGLKADGVWSKFEPAVAARGEEFTERTDRFGGTNNRHHGNRHNVKH